ncbi:hypothetical protein OPV22_005853 [Ensete ventricosum]|uniref:Uncharacterized protein n=1 Tax=Ensete ventricosum TaxID=4639 RepID=A0AAV8QA84_ENSVE|nr:hypothetical protein OPV22_005853 [Ensete ventricosum]
MSSFSANRTLPSSTSAHRPCHLCHCSSSPPLHRRRPSLPSPNVVAASRYRSPLVHGSVAAASLYCSIATHSSIVAAAFLCSLPPIVAISPFASTAVASTVTSFSQLPKAVAATLPLATAPLLLYSRSRDASLATLLPSTMAMLLS